MTLSAPQMGVGPRALLRRLREAMVEPVAAQQRLDRTVELIAANMVAEVCSIYIRRAGDQLELFATKGLQPSAVHKTRLRFGEGLVGEIARTAEPLNLTDAPHHPKFAYRPETGEDPFHSFLGVPILKGGHVLGVLVVQNQTQRHYSEEELEALQTVAMVLAEIVASGQLIQLDDAVIDEEITPTRPYRQNGVGFADGVAVGKVILHAPPIKDHALLAEDVTVELQRLEQGVEQLRQSIDSMLSAVDSSLIGEPRDVLEAYRMFAHDRGWVRRMEEAVGHGLTAEAAVEQVQSDTRARLSRQRDPYIRDRLHDLDDLAHRLLRFLAGKDNGSVREYPAGAILVAHNLGPAELLDYDPNRLGGVILAEGSPGSHVAIVARAMAVPMVGMVDGVLDHVKEGDWAVIDGENGEIYLRPTQGILSAYDEKIALHEQRQAKFTAIRNAPATTRDGHEIELQMNAGLLVDLQHLDLAGAQGIGLFRTELQFMVSSTMPRLGAQVSFYQEVLDTAGHRPVTFRTLDLGGDKILPYGHVRREANPALGLRAIRLALARPALLRYQLRALLMAAAGRGLRVMFPMVAEVEEYRQARALLDVEVERLKRLNQALPDKLEVGCMIEVPSLVWQLGALLPLVDFVSVGSNDLIQFFFASDRTNPQVSDRYDFLSPTVLGLLRHILAECRAHNLPVSLCGEAAGQPLEAMALIGLGFRTISMPPARIGPVKLMARGLHVEQLAQFMDDLFLRPDRSVRHLLKEYAEKNGVIV